MECSQITDLLPFLENGSLEAEERRHIESHLETCATCRYELNETRRAAQLFGAHLPTDAIVALAQRDSAQSDLLAQRHLDKCSECAEELSLARESRSAIEADAPSLHEPPRFLRHLSHGALAAGLLIAFGTGLFWGHERQRAPLTLAAAAQQALAEQLADERTAAAGLEARIEELSAPQLNLPIAEILPADVRRSNDSQKKRLVVPAGASRVAILLSTAATAENVRAVIRDPEGTTRWQGRGLTPSPLGGYTLGLPVSLLPEGSITIELHVDGRARPIEVFQLQIERRP